MKEDFIAFEKKMIPLQWRNLSIAPKKGQRVVAFDTGLQNMGCAIISFGTDVIIEKLDWRPLTNKKGRVNIATAVQDYVINVLVLDNQLLVPDVLLVEQSYYGRGVNPNTIVIEACLISFFKAYFPYINARSIRPSAHGNKGKERAATIGMMVVSDNKIGSTRWFKYLSDLIIPLDGNRRRDQHVCDAITMILDTMKFKGCEHLRR